MKKSQYIRKFFTLVGILLLTLVALTMTACSDDKGKGNSNAIFGPSLGTYYSYSGDTPPMQLVLNFSSDGSQIGANGELRIYSNIPGCPPIGTYRLETRAGNAGQYAGAGVFYNILTDSSLGQIELNGKLTGDVDMSGNLRADVDADIPGCFTSFI